MSRIFWDNPRQDLSLQQHIPYKLIVHMRFTSQIVLIAFCLGGGFLYGVLAAHYRWPPTGTLRRIGLLKTESQGRWRITGGEARGHIASAKERALADGLLTLGYMQGSVLATAEDTGVTLFDTSQVDTDGINLFNSGHTLGAALMNMEGQILHEWSIQFTDAWPDPLPFRKDFFRRVHMYPNGDLLGIFEGIGLVKIDKESKILWTNLGRMHHDIDIAPDGTIYTLTRDERSEHPEFELEGTVTEDFVTCLTPDGEIKKKISVLDAFLRSNFAPYMKLAARKGNFLHTNTLELLDGQHVEHNPILKKGHVLLSIRHIDAVAVLDPTAEVITWMVTGLWDAQHQPTVLDNTNFLIFDNLGHRESSQILEFNPLTLEIEWSYRGTEQEPFFSETCGSVQRLKNHNTLITETDRGRAFEVTRAGEIVWEFKSPYRAGEKNELVASLFEVIRFKKEVVEFLK